MNQQGTPSDTTPSLRETSRRRLDKQSDSLRETVDAITTRLQYEPACSILTYHNTGVRGLREAQDILAELNRTLDLMGIPGYQDVLYQQGYQDWKDGIPMHDNRYDPESDKGAAWLAGWNAAAEACLYSESEATDE